MADALPHLLRLLIAQPRVSFFKRVSSLLVLLILVILCELMRLNELKIALSINSIAWHDLLRSLVVHELGCWLVHVLLSSIYMIVHRTAVHMVSCIHRTTP